ncbi:MAG: nitroreductase [Thermomicrobium sp.]|nr:nitroreductase [Thermomicrobium sp.]
MNRSTTTDARAVLDAIRGRRSVKQVRPDPVPRELVEQLLEAAVWAPNHHLTQPWRFFVLTGEARVALGEVLARDPGLSPSKREAIRQKPLRAPVVIAVAIEPHPDRPLLDEIAAGAAAIQNMLLAAHALGLGAIWRTGRAIEDPAVKTFFGLSDRAFLLGFVYVGFPAAVPEPPPRRPVSECTVWFDVERARAALELVLAASVEAETTRAASG